jgi:hypothetical protein
MMIPNIDEMFQNMTDIQEDWMFVLEKALRYVASLLAEEDISELADGPRGWGKVAGGWCLFAWNFSVTRSNVLKEAERRTRPNTLSLR